jgi:hypothetical protein
MQKSMQRIMLMLALMLLQKRVVRNAIMELRNIIVNLAEEREFVSMAVKSLDVKIAKDLGFVNMAVKRLIVEIVKDLGFVNMTVKRDFALDAME